MTVSNEFVAVGYCTERDEANTEKKNLSIVFLSPLSCIQKMIHVKLLRSSNELL